MIKELLREFLFPTSSVMLDHQVSLKNGNISPKYVRYLTQVRATSHPSTCDISPKYVRHVAQVRATSQPSTCDISPKYVRHVAQVRATSHPNMCDFSPPKKKTWDISPTVLVSTVAGGRRELYTV